jgi:hypothetical protein
MTMTYTWEVTGLKNTADGTVVQTYWKKEGPDEHGNVGSFAGATPFDNGDPTAEGYIAFADLTEVDVLGWIQAVVVDDYEAHVNGQIQKQIDQLAISEADLPWAPTPDPAEDPAPEE